MLAFSADDLVREICVCFSSKSNGKKKSFQSVVEGINYLWNFFFFLKLIHRK